MRWSIRTKILIILSTLLLLVVSAYLILADKILREDKELLVFEMNRSNAEQIANELDGSIRRIVDKMELIAQLTLNRRKMEDAPENTSLAQTLFDKDPDLLALQLIQTLPHSSHSKSTAHLKIIGQLQAKRMLGSTHLNQELKQSQSFAVPPVRDIAVENRSDGSTILYQIRVPVTIQGGPAHSSYFAQAWVDGKSWQTPFEEDQSIALHFVLTASGHIFAHSNLNWVLNKKDLSDLPIFQQAQSNSFILQQMEFNFEQSQYLGVYRKTALGHLTVISMMHQKTARLASRRLLEKTIILSLIIVTLVLLISLYFSGTISTPLLSLVHTTRQIAQGNFDTPIEVQTHDEIGVLAAAFSQMAKELKSSRLLLEEYNRGLEKKVQERTKELENKNIAIQEQHEMILKSVRLAAVGEIAGQAAHEVLNPLTVMISNLETILSKLDEFTLSASAPLPLLRVILSQWERVFKRGGIEEWLKDMAQPSQIRANQTMAEEDTENLLIIFKEFDSFTSKIKDVLSILLRESLRVGRIVDQMRGLSRNTRTPQLINIHTLIQDSIQLTENYLLHFKVRIQTDFNSTPLYIRADSDEMRQVISNLIKNALDAIKETRNFEKLDLQSYREGLIHIQTHATDQQIKITIRDNGIGISDENRHKIFEGNFTTKGFQGTGFGLSICRRLIHGAGGDLILVGTEVGKYTEFAILFPRALDSSQADSDMPDMPDMEDT
jgi:signal transduction histidine kinase